MSQPRTLGHGWIGGVLGVALGGVGLGAVLCFHFPDRLTVPELRALYPVAWLRIALHVVLIAAFLLGALSAVLRRRKILGLSAMLLALVAVLLGGSRVPLDGELRDGPFLGLDWFLLNLIGYCAVFMPLERLFPRIAEQPSLRRHWATDLSYFFVSTLFVQVLTLLTLQPATLLLAWTSLPALRQAVAGQPLWAQAVEILLVVDLAQYWIHRAFHRVPWLWRFHRIHHSAESLDWLAGSRLHLVDVLVTRGLSYVPIHGLGFAEPAVLAYLVFVSVQATFIHANLRFELAALGRVLATPQFHHWHHGADAEAIDVNFAVHLPVLDRLFGTHHLPPGRWPAAYGLAGGPPVPPGYLRQLAAPFRGPG